MGAVSSERRNSPARVTTRAEAKMRRWGDSKGKQLTGAEHEEIHRRLGLGQTQVEAAAAVGCSDRSVRRLVVQGWRPRQKARDRSPRRLSCAEREEVSRGLRLGSSLRSIAVQLRRAPSTISREVTANGKPAEYRAFRAEQTAAARNRRPTRQEAGVEHSTSARS
jgi:Helix-turn-helix domain